MIESIRKHASKMMAYPDDTNLLFTSDSLLNTTSQTELTNANICEWISKNRLCLNIEKQVFFLKQPKPHYLKNIILNNAIINCKQNTILLGFVVGSKRKWNSHIGTICVSAQQYSRGIIKQLYLGFFRSNSK